jgi:hypothetical protein
MISLIIRLFNLLLLVVIVVAIVMTCFKALVGEG